MQRFHFRDPVDGANRESCKTNYTSGADRETHSLIKSQADGQPGSDMRIGCDNQLGWYRGLLKFVPSLFFEGTFFILNLGCQLADAI
ncbi:hypothetical protein [Effusibacillus consociatus]|uniref:hypothetical protein n=1 Tax=Effusibacillus consociatus TaxID=1117041 RepID=UPI0036D24789